MTQRTAPFPVWARPEAVISFAADAFAVILHDHLRACPARDLGITFARLPEEHRAGGKAMRRQDIAVELDILGGAMRAEVADLSPLALPRPHLLHRCLGGDI